MAFSANGYIARENGVEDFLSDENWVQFVRLAEKIGCFIVGRKTYEIVRKLYVSGYNFDTVHAARIVISKKQHKQAKGYVFVDSPETAIQQANELGFKEVLLTGGGTINSSFMQKGLIDEIIFDIEPFALGKGIQVFKPQTFECKLRLLDSKRLKNGILQVHYSTLR